VDGFVVLVQPGCGLVGLYVGVGRLWGWWVVGCGLVGYGLVGYGLSVRRLSVCTSYLVACPLPVLGGFPSFSSIPIPFFFVFAFFFRPFFSLQEYQDVGWLVLSLEYTLAE
jgi:hypothetical protein